MAQKNRKARRAAPAEAPATPAPSLRTPTRAAMQRTWPRFLALTAVCAALIWWLSGREPAGEPGQVWNAAHGHFHSASGAELPPAGRPGQVWDADHQHWHDADEASSPD